MHIIRKILVNFAALNHQTATQTMEYNFLEIEQKWKKYWTDHKVYKVNNDFNKPKYYVLDMFPYPSGAGLHVGHPLGYIASDIFARFKRNCGYNVLHPMGFDAFGLPAEQYALETGQHPADTTEKNIARYKQQLNNIGFSFDWDREVRTSDASYYKWTQWIFLRLFHSWYDRKANKARAISELETIFKTEGNKNNTSPADETLSFSADEWKAFSQAEQRSILMQYRLAYQGYAQVWWCEALGTVLANDEVVNGVSERGGHPVERKNMRQWFLRITEYAERLLSSLDTLDWSEPMKEMQRNWIGKSTGAEVKFKLSDSSHEITVFTTRPDTIYGVDFMVLAPENELVAIITTDAQKAEIEKYISYVKSRSERERMAEVKTVTGCFTGAYAEHPLTGNKIPVWISEYVLAGYGTGAIMAVPSGDDRDHKFAKHFNIPITNIFGDLYDGENAYTDKSGKIMNSDFVSGMDVKEAMNAVIDRLESNSRARRRINYKLRDAGFSRQRYWGEPFPIVYIDDVPYATDEAEVTALGLPTSLPVELPMVKNYKPGPEGQGPLANVTDWASPLPEVKVTRETNTMPGYAGSSWYFLRYMDPGNDAVFASKEATQYWNQVDLYVGGTEHAVGHLLYSRMWTKALCDLGEISFDEPFRKLLNQGMIQGSSRFIYRVKGTNQYVTAAKRKDYDTNDIRVDVNLVDGTELNMGGLRKWRPEYESAEFITDDDGKFYCGSEVEKMSKSKYNVVNPDDIVHQYGADTFRMYEMFLGPIEMSKPWDTKGIEGVHRFLKKMWRLYCDEQTGCIVNNDAATDAELRVLHKTIKKIREDIEKFSFNTCVSQFMITVNELSTLNCHKRAILEPLAVLISPFAPHIAEELWHMLGNEGTVVSAAFPEFNSQYTTDNSKVYPVAINGKTRCEMEFALDADAAFVEAEVLKNETIAKWTEGKAPKKFIYVKGKMINVVI